MSEDKLLKLQSKERELIRKTERLQAEERKVNQVKEGYVDHFRRSQQFFSDLQDHFRKHEGSRRFEELSIEFRRQSSKLMEGFEAGIQALKKERRQHEDALDDVLRNKQRLRQKEKESGQ